MILIVLNLLKVVLWPGIRSILGYIYWKIMYIHLLLGEMFYKY